MWAVMCAYATYIYSLWFFLSWLPSYLIEYRKFTLIKTGILLRCLLLPVLWRCLRRLADRQAADKDK